MAMKRASRGCQLDPVAATVQQLQAHLPFEFAHRGKDGRMRTIQHLGGGLEAAGADHGIEAAQVVQSERGHVRSSYKEYPYFVIFFLLPRN
jgi:hypothetical protein